MRTDRLAAVSRATDAAIRWHMTPRWRRRSGLLAAMRRAYRRPGDKPATRVVHYLNQSTDQEECGHGQAG